MSTIKDVARRAGVSISTVSYALSGARPISADTKEVIERAMKELDYRPHAIARSLASKKTRILALVFPPMERELGLSELSLITAAAQAATRAGYHLVLWSLTSTEDEELAELVYQGLVDGALLMEVHDGDARIPFLKAAGIPIFLFGRDRKSTGDNFVDIDFDATMEQALAWLRAKGHERVAFVNQGQDALDALYGPVVRAHVAFAERCGPLGIDGRELLCPADADAARRLLTPLLREPRRPTAVVSMNDRALPGLYRAVEDAGLRIPADVTIVSLVSARATALMCIPPVTTYEMPGSELMDRAINGLIALIENRAEATWRHTLPCRLEERESSADAP
jgi:DNA-binding LacI/PurR family transcriptional regulator